MIRNGLRHIREAMHSITRSFARSSLSILTVSLTLILVGLFGSVLLNVSDMADDATSKLEAFVYIDAGANKQDEEAIKQQLLAIEQVDTVVYSDKTEQLNKLVEKTPAFSLFQNDSNPLLNIYIVKVKDTNYLKQVAEQARKIKFVYKVNDGGQISTTLLQVSQGIQFWGMILIAILVFITIVLIMNTIRSTILSRQTEIEIMRLVGATKWFIRWPFLLEGALIGFFGSIAPMLLMAVGYTMFYNVFSRELINSAYSLIPANPFAIVFALVLCAIGTLIGGIGSAISVRRFLTK